MDDVRAAALAFCRAGIMARMFAMPVCGWLEGSGRLPVAQARTAGGAAQSAAATRSVRRVVIVEDSEDARLSLQKILEREGHTVHTAVDGPSGLDTIAELRPDVALIDTAGRLQNKSELMAELAKIVRSIRKVDEDAPHEVLLVLDATVGQNALSQVESFRAVAEITGLVMTKLDGTAKGGVLVALAQRHAIPIHFIGVGEKAEDLQSFDAQSFARALVGLS